MSNEGSFASFKSSRLLNETEFLNYATKEVKTANVIWIASHTPIMFFESEQSSELEKNYNKALQARFSNRELITHYFMCEECTTNKINNEIEDPIELANSLIEWSKKWSNNSNLYTYFVKRDIFPLESIWAVQRDQSISFALIKLKYEGSNRAIWLFIKEIPEGIIDIFDSLRKNAGTLLSYLNGWLKTMENTQDLE